MSQKNKRPLILSSIIIMLPCLVGILIRFFHPKTIDSEWIETSNNGFWNTKILLLLFFTLLILVIHWLCIYFILKDEKNYKQNDKILNLALWILPIFSLIGGCTLIEASTRKDFGFGFLGQLFFSTLFFVLGNYMPKCQPNHSVGIKVPWTLHNEENWTKTHRITGIIWVAGSVIMFLFLMIYETGFVSKSLPILIIMTVAPVLFSALYYKKQVKEGSVSKLEKDLSSKTNRYFLSSSSIGVIIALIVAVIFISGTIEYRFDEESLTIKANYWEDATVAYDEIDTVEYRENDLIGKRVIGFSSFFMMMGEYDNSEFGAYTRYSYSNCKSCVIIHADDQVLIINKKEEDATKKLYEALLAKTK